MESIYVSSINIDSNVEYIALSQDKVINAVSCTDSGKTMLALQLVPIYSRKERFLLFEKIKKDVLKNIDEINEIYITTDTDLYYKISQCKNDEIMFDEVLSIVKKRKK